MIIVIENETGRLHKFSSLVSCCKSMPGWSRKYLRNVKLSDMHKKYKGHNVYRVKNSGR